MGYAAHRVLLFPWEGNRCDLSTGYIYGLWFIKLPRIVHHRLHAHIRQCFLPDYKKTIYFRVYERMLVLRGVVILIFTYVWSVISGYILQSGFYCSFISVWMLSDNIFWKGFKVLYFVLLYRGVVTLPTWPVRMNKFFDIERQKCFLRNLWSSFVLLHICYIIYKRMSLHSCFNGGRRPGYSRSGFFSFQNAIVC